MAARSLEHLSERSPVREILRDAAALALSREQLRALEAIDRELSARGDSALAALRAADARGGSEPGPGRRIRQTQNVLLRAGGDAEERALAILTPDQLARLQRLAAERSARRN